MTRTTALASDKPLGIKAYGHIAHLPGSRMGPGDHKCHEGQARIATERARDRHDRIYVQEKLDGSCVAVAKLNGELIPLQRAGYRAVSSPYHQHVLFHGWVMDNWQRFDDLLNEGERAVGEWLAMAHGTRYDLAGRDPFVLFDIMSGPERLTVEAVDDRNRDFARPAVVATQPASVEDALAALGTYGHYGALDPIEGAVWRVERHGKVDFLVKYVRPDKVDGSYFGDEPVWNWQPEKVAA